MSFVIFSIVISYIYFMIGATHSADNIHFKNHESDYHIFNNINNADILPSPTSTVNSIAEVINTRNFFIATQPDTYINLDLINTHHDFDKITHDPLETDKLKDQEWKAKVQIKKHENNWESFNSKKLGINEAGSTLPIILTEPESGFVMKNRPAIIKCKAIYALQVQFKCTGSLQPPPSIHDKYVDPHTGIHMEEVTATINRDLVDEYFGKRSFQCECQAWSSRGIVKSQPASINIAYMRKQFEKSPTSLKIELGSIAEFKCLPPIGFPEPNISWYKDQTLINSKSDSEAIIRSSGFFRIPQVSFLDMGNYTCVAENIAGKRISESALLIVHEKFERLHSGSLDISRSDKYFDWALLMVFALTIIICVTLGTIFICQSQRCLYSNSHQDTIQKENKNTTCIGDKDLQLHEKNSRWGSDNYSHISNEMNLICASSEHYYNIPNLSTEYSHPEDNLSPVDNFKDDAQFTGAENLSKCDIQSRAESIASDIISSNGGHLHLYNNQILLYIPEFSIDKKTKIEMSIMGFPDDTTNFSLTTTESTFICSNMIYCSPSNYQFIKPVIIKIPHCLIDLDAWKINIYYAKNQYDNTSTNWQKVVTVGEETINAPIFVQMETMHVYIMTEELGRFVVAAEQNYESLQKILSFKMKLFAFSQFTPSSSNFSLRIYMVKDLPNSKDLCSYIESQIDGTYIGESETFCFKMDNSNLSIRVYNFEGLAYEHVQTIPYYHIVNGNSSLHCEFNIQYIATSPNYYIIFKQCIDIEDPGEWNSFTISIPSCENQNEKINRAMIKIDKLGYHYSETKIENDKLPYNIKRKLCLLLDSPRADGVDWRLLAKKLNINSYTAYFATKPSPTEQILNLLECRNRATTTSFVTELLTVFKEMNRQDLMDITANSVQPLWI